MRYKTGDAVRVKASSPTWLTVGGRMEPSGKSFGTKLVIEKQAAPTAKGDECYHVTHNGTHHDGIGGQFLEPWNDAEEWRDGAWVARKPAATYRVGDRVRITGLSQIGYDYRGKTGRVTTVGVTAGRDYVNVDIDGEPSAANRTYYLDAIEPAPTPKQFAKGVAVRLLPGFESVLCSGYDANAIRGKRLITVHESLSYGGIALSETVGGARLATLQNSEYLEAWVEPAPTPSHIVMLREDGRLKPNSPPVEHVSQGDAEREAERLAAKAPGSAFEVWGCVATRRVGPPKPQYKTGEQVRVTSNGDGRDTARHYLKVGSIATVNSVGTNLDLTGTNGEKCISQSVSPCCVEPLDASKPATASQVFRDGDTIRVIRDTRCLGIGGTFRKGETLQVDDHRPTAGELINAHSGRTGCVHAIRRADTEVVS